MDEHLEYWEMRRQEEARKRRRRRRHAWIRRWNLSVMVGVLIVLKVYELARRR